MIDRLVHFLDEFERAFRKRCCYFGLLNSPLLCPLCLSLLLPVCLSLTHRHTHQLGSAMRLLGLSAPSGSVPCTHWHATEPCVCECMCFLGCEKQKGEDQSCREESLPCHRGCKWEREEERWSSDNIRSLLCPLLIGFSRNSQSLRSNMQQINPTNLKLRGRCHHFRD